MFTGKGADPNKPKAIKAKLLRQQKKKAKLLQQGDQPGVAEASTSSQGHNEKSLADLLGEYDSATAKHKFEVSVS